MRKMFQLLYRDSNGNKFSLIGQMDKDGWWSYQLISGHNPDGQYIMLTNHWDDLPLTGKLTYVQNIILEKSKKYSALEMVTVREARKAQKLLGYNPNVQVGID